MKARIVKIKADDPDDEKLMQAVKHLDRGEVIVCPTDTGYAFAANALNTKAVAGVFHLKGRAFSNPVHIAVPNIEAAVKYAMVNDTARYLAERYLPGALTLVMKKRDIIPSMLVAGMETVGIRIPDNRVILELLQRIDYPLTTTSANVSGQPGTYAVDEITAQLEEKINTVSLLLDQGVIKNSEVSTIIDVSVTPPQLIRQGKLSWLDIREELRRFNVEERLSE